MLSFEYYSAVNVSGLDLSTFSAPTLVGFNSETCW